MCRVIHISFEFGHSFHFFFFCYFLFGIRDKFIVSVNSCTCLLACALFKCNKENNHNYNRFVELQVARFDWYLSKWKVFLLFFFSLTIHWMQNNVTQKLQCFDYMSYSVWHMWVFSHGFMAMNPFDWQNDALTHKFALRFGHQNWWFVLVQWSHFSVPMNNELAICRSVSYWPAALPWHLSIIDQMATLNSCK